MRIIKIGILVSFIFIIGIFFCGISHAILLSDMTLGDSVSLNDRLALADNVALGDGFSLVDESKGIKLWDLVTLRPVFRLQEQFDSNVYLDEKDAKPDFITSLDAGTEAKLKLGDLILMGGYLFNMNLFTEHNDQNNFNHTVIVKADWKLTNFEIICQDSYENFSDRSGSEDTARISRQKNVFSADALGEYGRLALDSGYDYIIEDYLSDEIIFNTLTYHEVESRQEHVFREEVSYRFFPKTSLLAEADYGFILYDNGYKPDSYFLQFLGGLKGEPLRDSVATLKAGVRFQDYDSDTARNFIGLVCRGDITKKFGAKNTVSATLERSVNESTYDGMNYYILNHAGLGYVHQFNDKWSAHFAGSYQINEYPEKTVEDGRYDRRFDYIYRGACGLKYDIRPWLTTAIAYQYLQKESSFPDFEYIDNLVSWSVVAQF